MRRLLLAALLPISACGGGSDGGNQAWGNAPAAASSVAPETTPVLNVAGTPGNEATWMEPQVSPGPRPSAPYGNLLDAPVVETPRAK
jgi:hypothetical protein